VTLASAGLTPADAVSGFAVLLGIPARGADPLHVFCRSCLPWLLAAAKEPARVWRQSRVGGQGRYASVPFHRSRLLIGGSRSRTCFRM